MEHFEDAPFYAVFREIDQLRKRHHFNLSRLEAQMILHAYNMISEVHQAAKDRHYEREESKLLAETTAAAL